MRLRGIIVTFLAWCCLSFGFVNILHFFVEINRVYGSFQR